MMLSIMSRRCADRRNVRAADDGGKYTHRRSCAAALVRRRSPEIQHNARKSYR